MYGQAAQAKQTCPGVEGTTFMRTMLALLALICVISSVGCCGARSAAGACQGCGHGNGCIRNGFFARNFGPSVHTSPTEEGMGAPQSAQVAYPYYTTRGPRDFLLNNPPPLGY
jgi:hypothetical protein